MGSIFSIRWASYTCPTASRLWKTGVSTPLPLLYLGCIKVCGSLDIAEKLISLRNLSAQSDLILCRLLPQKIFPFVKNNGKTSIPVHLIPFILVGISTAICWTSPFVILGVSGLFSRFNSVSDAKSC